MLEIRVLNNNLNTLKNENEYICVLLKNVVDLINIVHPRLLSIYLIGSYVDGQYKLGSDLDLVVIMPKDNKPADGFKKILCHISPIVIDIKFYNENELIDGKTIIDPCINFKRKLLYGEENKELFNYRLDQYLALNVDKINNFLLECCLSDKDVPLILNREFFKNIGSKKYYSIISRLLRCFLGYKYKAVTYTKEQSLISFLEHEPNSLISQPIRSLLLEIGKDGYLKVSDANCDLFMQVYTFVRNNKYNLINLPEIRFEHSA